MPLAALIAVAPSLLLAAAVVAGAVLFLGLRGEAVNQCRRMAALERTQTEAVTMLQASFRELEERIRLLEERPANPLNNPVARVLNLNSRAQALRMLRRGMKAETVAASLNLPRPEVELLVRVRRLEEAAENLTAGNPA